MEQTLDGCVENREIECIDWKKLMSGDFMYDRVGKQIKELAASIAQSILLQVVFVRVAVVAVPFFVNDDMNFLWFLLSVIAAFFVLWIGYTVAWRSGLMMYGFGELIDRAASIDEKLENGVPLPEVSAHIISREPQNGLLHRWEKDADTNHDFQRKTWEDFIYESNRNCAPH